MVMMPNHNRQRPELFSEKKEEKNIEMKSVIYKTENSFNFKCYQALCTHETEKAKKKDG